MTQLGEKRKEFKDFNYEAWLAIEITSFYLLVAGAVLYIAVHMIASLIWPNQVKDTENKDRDFVSWRIKSITWYSFNTIMIGIPLIMLILEW